ncbi:putative concanavalin A-like lectin/glucanase domain superfamily [Septoria linicola]|nr:putative concanavalin A-like lectin/glucanase domain superfamily [Septoria linicola]
MWSSTFISYTALLSLLIPYSSAQRRAGGRFIAGGGIPGAAPYTLVDDYNASNFFDTFFFFSSADLTNGHVQYRNRSIAQRDELAFISDRNTVVLKPDTTNSYPGPAGDPGRPSVRLESLNAYSHGLFIFDAYHVPFGCGTWPAYWMAGPRFPTTGEIGV